MHHAGVVQFLEGDDKIGERVVEYAVKWSKQLGEDEWTGVRKAKEMIRGPLRKEAEIAMREEFDVLYDLERSGVMQRLLASRVSHVQSAAASRRRAML